VIYLSKILPLLLLPLAWVIILCVVGAIRRSRLLVLLGVTIIYIASIPLVAGPLFHFIEDGQERLLAADMKPADAIVVLSGMLRAPRGNARITEWGDPNRFFAGIELFKAGKAPILIFTGGWVPWEPDAPPEGEVLMKFARDFNVPENAMRVTGKVSNTAEEAKAVGALIRDAHLSGSKEKPTILLVTSAFHMRRARSLFERSGMEVIPFPVDFKGSATKQMTLMDFLPSGASLSGTEAAIRELYGRAFWSIFKG